MAKVITFSRTFPAYHPKKGQPTYFVEKFWKSRLAGESDIDKALTPISGFIYEVGQMLGYEYADIAFHHTEKQLPKHHTIRAGKRWKAGDYFSPRVWSGKPYNSKQIIIGPDTLLEKVWDFEVVNDGLFCAILINKKVIPSIEIFNQIAKNDGLDPEDLDKWFQLPKSFDGQIICWNPDVNY